MIAWINVGVLLAATLLFLTFYVRSVGPAALEKRIGASAYPLCARYRFISGVFLALATVNYVVYYFYPLPFSLPGALPWPHWLSALLGAIVTIPSCYLMWRGIRDAGIETMRPQKDQTLYRGVYDRIRHPQAAGESPLFLALAFLLHSPFLVIYSLVWIPIFVLTSLAEERDLLLRYGAPYQAYRERTGFYFPKRRRRP